MAAPLAESAATRRKQKLALYIAQTVPRSSERLRVARSEWSDELRFKESFEVPEHSLLGLMVELRVGPVESAEPVVQHKSLVTVEA